MKLSAAQLAAGTAALIALAGCKPVGPNYARPDYSAPAAYKEASGPSMLAPNPAPPPNPQGGSWKPASPSDGLLRGKWWEIYNDAQLNKLEERIASNNQDLKSALETYLAARDQIQVARAALAPTLSAGPGFTHTKLSENEPNYSSSTKTSYNTLTLTGEASWEPDFFGRIRRTVESARASAVASAADLANLDLLLHAQLATAYFELRGADAQKKLLEATVADRESSLRLTEQRLAGGVATEADVADARTALETARTQLIDVGIARAQYEHAVGTLAYYKLTEFSIPPSPLEAEPPRIPVGIPSQLLERRPDIAAAERRAAAANAQIGIAVSAYYPDIPLSASGGFESTHGGTWIQGPSALWTLGAQATELLFDAGQRHALTDQARHNYESEVALYKSTVFHAFNDVEDQMSTLRILGDESQAADKAVDAAAHSYEIAQQRYKGGVTSYLEVLTAQSALFDNQRNAIDVEMRRFTASVALIRALGGGWDTGSLPK